MGGELADFADSSTRSRPQLLLMLTLAAFAYRLANLSSEPSRPIRARRPAIAVSKSIARR